jgi:hypothetical protein
MICRKNQCPNRLGTVSRGYDVPNAVADKARRMRGQNRNCHCGWSGVYCWYSVAPAQSHIGCALCTHTRTRAHTQYFDTQCTFVDALFIAFNLVANLTMAEMTAANSLLAVVYIVCFVTFGLVVLGMCGDLALAGEVFTCRAPHSYTLCSELKWLFTKIHYFGRVIQKRRLSKLDIQQQRELEALMHIIAHIRQKYPYKIEITPNDLQEVGWVCSCPPTHCSTC